MPHFQFEEINLMCICNITSRYVLIDELGRLVNHLMDDESELRTLSNSVIGKLTNMTDAQFEELKPSLISDFDEQEE